MKPKDIARLCHEANRAYCLSMGDYSQPAWEHAPAWAQQSALNGVIYHANHPDSSPRDAHEMWMREKLADGWSHGTRKDAEAKTHPCLLPYDLLPREQQAKDFIFLGIVRACLPHE